MLELGHKIWQEVKYGKVRAFQTKKNDSVLGTGHESIPFCRVVSSVGED